MAESKCICGRCGYDLSGIVESWGDEHNTREGAACPLEGQCSECGSEFRWRDIFFAEKLDLPWLVEHANTRWSLLKRIPGTVLRALLPWIFWRRISLQSRVQPKRVLLAGVLLIALMHLVGGMFLANQSIQVQYQYSAWNLGPGQRYAPLDLSSAPAILAKIVLGHSVSLDMNWALLPSKSNINTMIPGVPAGKNTTLSLTYVGFWMPPAVAYGLSMSVSWLLLMALLPTTRKLAKLRWAHVARALVYSVIGVGVAHEITRMLAYAAFMGPDLSAIVMVASIVWVILWWSSAVAFGWRLKHRWGVVIMLNFAALLMSLFGAIFLNLLADLITAPFAPFSGTRW